MSELDYGPADAEWVTYWDGLTDDEKRTELDAMTTYAMEADENER